MSFLSQADQAAIPLAKQCETATGLPWELTLAQFILESGHGQHVPGCNPWGIKTYPGMWKSQILKTTEYVKGVPHTFSLPFAAFPDLASSFAKHAELITKGVPYAAQWRAWQADPNRTPQSLARAIAPIYATDPDYADQLVTIMADVTAALAGSEAVQA